MSEIHTVNSIHGAVGHEPSRVHSRNLKGLSEHDEDATSQFNDDEDPNSDLKRASTVSMEDRPSHPGDATMKTVSRLSPFGCLLSRTLPAYKGAYNVGVFDLELPVSDPRWIGSFRHKELHSPQPGFALETVLFTVFYPADISQGTDSSKVVWFPRLSQTVNGFLKMARRTSWLYKALAYPIAAAAIYGTTFPAVAEAPLLKPPRTGQQWPLAIFSHGVGCSRLMYSSICGELASRGYIVCAIEHRDGTGPSTAIRLDDGTYKDLDFLNWQNLNWPDLPMDQQPDNDTILRHDQLEMRCAEIKEVVLLMQAINAGDPVVKKAMKGRKFDWERWGPEWDAVNCNRPVMVGHSLGGSAALLAASRADEFHFRSIVVMDPACQRLEPWTGSIACPMLAINSEEYTLSSDYARLQELAQTANTPPVYSISGSTHPSFSDVFLIVPGFINRMTGLNVPADEMLDSTMDLVLSFLRDDHKPMRTTTQMIREWQGPLSRPLGEPGVIHWHPVGEETLLQSVSQEEEGGKEDEGMNGIESNKDPASHRVHSIDEDREYATPDSQEQAAASVISGSGANGSANDPNEHGVQRKEGGILHHGHHHMQNMHVILHDTVKAAKKRDDLVHD